MKNDSTILCCKRCGSFLVQKPDQYFCHHCSQAYPVKEGIVLVEEKDETYLRIGDRLLDLYELRNERKYYGTYILSDVEYVARLHSVNFSNFHLEMLSPYISDSIILDLGCGQLPYISSCLNKKIKIYYGLDLNPEALSIARSNFKGKFPLVLVKHGVENTPFSDASVDIVISSEVIEHLDNPQIYLKEIYRVMKNGGHLSLSTPCASMYFYPYNLIYMGANPTEWFKRVNCHKYWNEALTWHPGLRPGVLKKWVKESGFSILRHTTKLWYYHTPIRMMWRLFSIVEKIGIPYTGNIFYKYLKMMDGLLNSNIPIVNKAGIRQFILCKK
jgi:ubiquinone/menaquinone biosynthesis C-methylase UbiE